MGEWAVCKSKTILPEVALAHFLRLKKTAKGVIMSRNSFRKEGRQEAGAHPRRALLLH